MNKKIFLVILGLLLWAGQAFGTQYYVDNSCGAAACSGASCGQSTTCHATTGPFATLALAAAKAGGYAAGDIISLKKSLTFYELWTFPSSGSTGNPITINSYGTGEKPIITAAFQSPSWSEYDDGRAGTKVWVANIGAVDPVKVWRVTSAGQTFLMQENTTSADVLDDLEWYYSNPNLYVRDDSGSAAPTDTIKAPVRAQCINMSNKQFLTFDGLAFHFMLSAGLQGTTSTEEWTIKNCDFLYSAGYAVNFAGAVKNTIFERNVVRDSISATASLNIATGTDAANLMTIRYNFFADNIGATPITLSNAAGQVDIYNNTFVGGSGGYVSNSSTTNTVNNRNNIYAAAGYGTAGDLIYQATTTGHHYFGNNIITPHGRDATKMIDADVDTTTVGNNIYDDAKFIRPERYGVICYTEDNIFLGSQELVPTAATYGIPITYFLSGVEYNTGTWNAAMINKVKGWINDGYVEVGGHSKSHVQFTEMTGITVQYVGAGAAATMTISGNTLATTVDGSGDLSLDLTAAAYDTIGELCDYIHADADYTCTNTATHDAMSSTYLADIAGQDIKTATYAAVYDAARYAAGEVTAVKTKLDADLAPYAVESFAYPGTSPAANSDIVKQMAGTGFTSARTVGNVTYWNAAAGVDLYHWDNYGLATGLVTYYACDNSLNDAGGGSLTLTGTDMAYSTSRAYGANSCIFNGSTTKAIRADSASWDFSGGDWALTMMIKPTGFAAKQVIYSQATDADNFMEIYIDTSGYLHLDIKAGGAYTLQLAQTANALSTSNWNRIVIYEAVDRYRIYTSTYTGTTPDDTSATWTAMTLRASTTSTARPANYTGSVTFGAFSANGSDYSDFYGGLMDVMVHAKNTWRNMMSWFQTIAHHGHVSSHLTHGESPGARGLYIPVWDALKEFNGGTISSTSGYVRPMKVRDMVTWLKANGRAVTDVRATTDKWRFDIPRNLTDALHHTSPAIYTGADLSITGGDRYGIPLRDSTKPTRGAQEAYPKMF